MSHSYSPTPPVVTLTLPDDGDANSAASVNTPFEELADGLATALVLTDRFTATGTWTAPPGVTKAVLIGWGGGSGGAHGQAPSASGTNTYGTGGAGGAGSRKHVVEVSVTPGTSYTITIPTAAAGGASDGLAGADGGDVIFKITAGATLATFRGAGQSADSDDNSTSTSDYCVARGGQPVRGRQPPSIKTSATDVLLAMTMLTLPDGSGGVGSTSNANAYFRFPDGQPSAEGYGGGTGGTDGADDSTVRGGGKGGGGGAGPGGAGGNAGNGGAGVGVGGGGAGAAGGAGSNAAANSGAGGGGGGGGGGGSTTVGAGGVGGNGGTGTLSVVYVGAQAVVT